MIDFTPIASSKLDDYMFMRFLLLNKIYVKHVTNVCIGQDTHGFHSSFRHYRIDGGYSWSDIKEKGLFWMIMCDKFDDYKFKCLGRCVKRPNKHKIFKK